MRYTVDLLSNKENIHPVIYMLPCCLSRDIRLEFIPREKIVETHLHRTLGILSPRWRTFNQKLKKSLVTRQPKGEKRLVYEHLHVHTSDFEYFWNGINEPRNATRAPPYIHLRKQARTTRDEYDKPISINFRSFTVALFHTVNSDKLSNTVLYHLELIPRLAYYQADHNY